MTVSSSVQTHGALGRLVAQAFEVYLSVAWGLCRLVKTQRLLGSILKPKKTSCTVVTLPRMVLDLDAHQICCFRDKFVRDHIGVSGISLTTFHPRVGRKAMFSIILTQRNGCNRERDQGDVTQLV